MKKFHQICAILFITIFCLKLIYSGHLSEQYVRIKSQKHITYFNLPTSEEPVTSWMDIQKGIYPNTSVILDVINVGEPITMFIYLEDKSRLYDIMATDCFAHDKPDFGKSTHKIALIANSNKKVKKSIGKWYQHKNSENNTITKFIYSSFSSFKFPEDDQLYFLCNIELCFKKCKS